MLTDAGAKRDWDWGEVLGACTMEITPSWEERRRREGRGANMRVLEGGKKRRAGRRGEREVQRGWKVEDERKRRPMVIEWWKRDYGGRFIDLRRGDRRGYHISLIASSRYLI